METRWITIRTSCIPTSPVYVSFDTLLSSWKQRRSKGSQFHWQFTFISLFPYLHVPLLCSIGLYEDYHWKVSLWNTKSSRISRDLFLKADNFNDVHVFELPALNAKDQSSHTYIYVDLVHRYSPQCRCAYLCPVASHHYL